jgi:tyrosyl-tRNA synthetase
MSIPDALMTEYFDLLHDDSWEALREWRSSGASARDPLAVKHELATRIVARFHGHDASRDARSHFERVVQRKEVPDDVPERQLLLGDQNGLGLLEALEKLGLAKSRSDARRLIAQGAVTVDGRRVEDAALMLRVGSYLIQVGKRRFIRLGVGGFALKPGA